MFISLRNHHPVSTEAVPFYPPAIQQFLHIIVNTCYCLFHHNHPTEHEVVPHCDFYLHLMEFQLSYFKS